MRVTVSVFLDASNFSWGFFRPFVSFRFFSFKLPSALYLTLFSGAGDDAGDGVEW